MTSALRRGAILLGLIAVAALILVCSPGCSMLTDIIDPATLDADAKRYRDLSPLVDDHISRYPHERTSWENMMREWKTDIENRGGNTNPPSLVPIP